MMRPYKQAILSLCDHSGEWSRPYIGQGYEVIRVDPKHAAIDHGGTGYTSGSAGSGRMELMPDGGYGLGLTAGALVDLLEDDPNELARKLWVASGYRSDSYVATFTGLQIVGVLAAPPCTDFSSSGARWFAAKDADGRTDASVSIVRDCLRVVQLVKPDWWVLENPVGRIASLVPELGEPLLRFHPCDYAGHADDPDRESYTKRTALYGDFNADLPADPREPVWYYRTSAKGKVMRGSWMWANLGGKSERTKALRSVTPTGFARAFCMANN